MTPSSAAHAALISLLLAAASGCRTNGIPLSVHRAERPETPVASSASEDAPAITPSDVQLTAAEELVKDSAVPNLEAVEVLDLATLEQYALENNPALKQANAAVAKAVGFRDQVGLYPNPTAGYNGTQLADRGTDQHVGFIEQEIVTGHKLQRNRLVLAQEVQAQLWQAEATRLRIVTDVRTRFYETLAGQERVRLAQEFETVVAEGVQAARKRIDALEGSRPELLQTQIQQSEVQLLKQRAEIAYLASWKSLFAVVGTPCEFNQGLAGSLEVPLEHQDWEATYGQLAEVSPEVRMACSRVAWAQANLERQQVQPIPNLAVMVAGGYDKGTGSELINTQIGVPIPLFNRNQGNIAAAWGEYCRATQELQRVKLALRTRLLEAGRTYDSAAAQVRRYDEEILPMAKEALTLAEQSFRAGEMEFLQVLIVRRTFFDSNLQTVQARMEFAQASALVDGLLLSGSLSESTDTAADDGLRGQTLGGQ